MWKPPPRFITHRRPAGLPLGRTLGGRMHRGQRRSVGISRAIRGWFTPHPSGIQGVCPMWCRRRQPAWAATASMSAPSTAGGVRPRAPRLPRATGGLHHPRTVPTSATLPSGKTTLQRFRLQPIENQPIVMLAANGQKLKQVMPAYLKVSYRGSTLSPPRVFPASPTTCGVASDRQSPKLLNSFATKHAQASRPSALPLPRAPGSQSPPPCLPFSAGSSSSSSRQRTSSFRARASSMPGKLPTLPLIHG